MVSRSLKDSITTAKSTAASSEYSPFLGWYLECIEFYRYEVSIDLLLRDVFGRIFLGLEIDLSVDICSSSVKLLTTTLLHQMQETATELLLLL